ncbi:insulinase family protein [Patescibacteria group bacterium]|nr:insulinase family protein [Patescibacteria group bacterium]MBU3999986.1 insulinase family protein [Patescibacteria group bacterium]MBU4057230.1 insulinase family protein [Patescibacteria group bacterium]MBU4368340.1 insulinase family protein [Patescibacteria group bacterium]
MHQKTILKNGLRVIIAPMAGTKTATVLVMVGTGGKYETRETSGISHFLEHLFFKGTKKRQTTSKIAESLEILGADYDAFTSKEYTGFYAKTANFNFDKSAEIISDILINSLFFKEEIERERGVILEEIKMIKDDPPRYIGDLFEILLYGDTPAGWDFGGTPETVGSIAREQILKYFKSQYVSKNIVISVAGAVNETDVLREVKKYFGDFNGRDFKRKDPVKEKQEKPQVLLYNKKTDQTHISLGVRAYSMAHADRHVLALLGIILGGGMSSRLFTSVRGDLGLAYYIYSSSDLYTDCGYFTTQAGIDAKNVEKTVGIILSEYKKIAEKGPAAAELQKVKDYIKGRMIMSLESSSAMASFFAGQEILEGKILTPEEKMAKIDAVSVDDIQRVAKDIFKNEKLNLAVVGPLKKKDEERLGKILRL